VVNLLEELLIILMRNYGATPEIIYRNRNNMSEMMHGERWTKRSEAGEEVKV
jgi:hypothetical protein